ncbi:hypothetical protein SCH01S_03_00280 [Sphingomonas changbaiensis NBRC 104936]|uniref:DUF4230 domain-containing protein n=1 Tax=Sphingomonas changbaiensis NBRC 104936 TaxID=1219043 RepID=A0A0E9MKJ1_9SPHN|nr:DUF4230 domain-containing protein [Sphingomonas changbaiensis]GAO38054.1 hypothetical protein SCH01S_03_00280 [Sphingomonas changbaiensis NBRC 104936]
MTRELRSALIGGLVAIAVLAAGFFAMKSYLTSKFAPDPETIASSTLSGMREQNRLTSFIASYVAVVTSEQSRLGLTARKTLIMPGTVRYEVDLGKLGPEDLSWDDGRNELTVTLPPVEIAGPQVDLNAIREYDGGGLLMRLTNAEERLDDANRKAAQAELLRQAKAPTPMRIAREATRRAVERNFALPLRAAGLDAHVTVRFPDEGHSAEQMDRSTPLNEAVATH